MEDPDVDPNQVVLNDCCVTIAVGCPTCLGDLDGDTWTSPDDVYNLIARIEHAPAGWGYWLPDSNSYYHICGDMDEDNWLSPDDVYALIALIETAPEGWGYWKECP